MSILKVELVSLDFLLFLLHIAICTVPSYNNYCDCNETLASTDLVTIQEMVKRHWKLLESYFTDTFCRR